MDFKNHECYKMKLFLDFSRVYDLSRVYLPAWTNIWNYMNGLLLFSPFCFSLFLSLLFFPSYFSLVLFFLFFFVCFVLLITLNPWWNRKDRRAWWRGLSVGFSGRHERETCLKINGPLANLGRTEKSHSSLSEFNIKKIYFIVQTRFCLSLNKICIGK